MAAEIEDDELAALRMAVLASMKPVQSNVPKEKKSEEEDLDALRAAVLQSRKGKEDATKPAETALSFQSQHMSQVQQHQIFQRGRGRGGFNSKPLKGNLIVINTAPAQDENLPSEHFSLSKNNSPSKIMMMLRPQDKYTDEAAGSQSPQQTTQSKAPGRFARLESGDSDSEDESEDESDIEVPEFKNNVSLSDAGSDAELDQNSSAETLDRDKLEASDSDSDTESSRLMSQPEQLSSPSITPDDTESALNSQDNSNKTDEVQNNTVSDVSRSYVGESKSYDQSNKTNELIPHSNVSNRQERTQSNSMNTRCVYDKDKDRKSGRYESRSSRTYKHRKEYHRTRDDDKRSYKSLGSSSHSDKRHDRKKRLADNKIINSNKELVPNKRTKPSRTHSTSSSNLSVSDISDSGSENENGATWRFQHTGKNAKRKVKYERSDSDIQSNGAKLNRERHLKEREDRYQHGLKERQQRNRRHESPHTRLESRRRDRHSHSPRPKIDSKRHEHVIGERLKRTGFESESGSEDDVRKSSIRSNVIQPKKLIRSQIPDEKKAVPLMDLRLKMRNRRGQDHDRNTEQIMPLIPDARDYIKRRKESRGKHKEYREVEEDFEEDQADEVKRTTQNKSPEIHITFDQEKSSKGSYLKEKPLKKSSVMARLGAKRTITSEHLSDYEPPRTSVKRRVIAEEPSSLRKSEKPPESEKRSRKVNVDLDPSSRKVSSRETTRNILEERLPEKDSARNARQRSKERHRSREFINDSRKKKVEKQAGFEKDKGESEAMLDARIQKINENNAKIRRRKMEIDAEMKRFSK